MPQLMIPALGATLALQEPWTFGLYRERKNETLIQALSITSPRPRDGMFNTHGWPETYSIDAANTGEMTLADGSTRFVRYGERIMPVTLPAGTVLVVDRIYVRKGSKDFDFDSVTFRIKECPAGDLMSRRPKYRAIRFWAKLEDVNGMVVE